MPSTNAAIRCCAVVGAVLWLPILALPAAGQPTPIEFVQTIGSAVETTSGSSIIIPVTGARTGFRNTVIVAVALLDGSRFDQFDATDSRGNVYIRDASNGTGLVYTIIFSAELVSELEPSDTITINHPLANKRAAVAAEFSGVGPLDQLNSGAGSSSIVQTGAVIINFDPELVIGAVGVRGTPSLSPNFSFTQPVSAMTNTGSGDVSLFLQFRTSSNGAAFQAGGTLSSPAAWAADIAAYRGERFRTPTRTSTFTVTPTRTPTFTHPGTPAATDTPTVPIAPAALRVFNNKDDFVGETGASNATGPLPDLGAVITGANPDDGVTVGSITFRLGPGGGDLSIGAMGQGLPGDDWYPETPGNDIALQYENLEIDTAAPVYGLGFDIVEPNLTMPPWGGVPVDSTFEVTLLLGAQEIGRFSFNVPDDVSAFVGVGSSQPFDRALVNEVVPTDEDEYFGEVYTGDRPLRTSRLDFGVLQAAVFGPPYPAPPLRFAVAAASGEQEVPIELLDLALAAAHNAGTLDPLPLQIEASTAETPLISVMLTEGGTAALPFVSFFDMSLVLTQHPDSSSEPSVASPPPIVPQPTFFEVSYEASLAGTHLTAPQMLRFAIGAQQPLEFADVALQQPPLLRSSAETPLPDGFHVSFHLVRRDGELNTGPLFTITTQGNLFHPTCVGDCNDSGAVTVDELVRGVNAARGSASDPSCPGFDSAAASVTVDELITAVNNALRGCP